MSVNTKMTALADQVRTLSGGTGVLGIDAMTNAVKGGNDEISGQSDLIAQISAALEGKAAPGGGITPTGTIEITENGTHDVTEYATAEVNVPSKEPVLQEGSATPTKGQQTINPPSGVDGFSKFVVEKIPDRYIVPEGTAEITKNGEHDVSEYASVNVNVPDVPAVVEELNVTENGEYAPGDGVDGFSRVTVNVPSSGGGDAGLPAGYSRVDFIQFSGAALVDTGIVGTQESKINVLFTWENSTQRNLFGCASSDNKASITSYMNGSWRFGDKSTSKSLSTKNENLPYSALVDKTTISLNSSVTSISGVNTFQTVGTLLLGGARDADGTLPGVMFTGKVFGFMHWISGEQVQKLVPVVSADGVYRFFDLVTREFFDSITSTPLGGGNL